MPSGVRKSSALAYVPPKWRNHFLEPALTFAELENIRFTEAKPEVTLPDTYGFSPKRPCFVMMFTMPPMAPVPYKDDWAPLITSTRSTSFTSTILKEAVRSVAVSTLFPSMRITKRSSLKPRTLMLVAQTPSPPRVTPGSCSNTLDKVKADCLWYKAESTTTREAGTFRTWRSIFRLVTTISPRVTGMVSFFSTS